MEPQEDSVFIRHTSCSSCGSSDANAEYSNGSTYCFSCRVSTQPNSSKITRSRPMAANLLQNLEPIEKTLRGIKPETFAKFGYKYGEMSEGEKVQVAPYYSGNQVVAQKCRTKSKDFKCLGDMKAAQLFGMNLWSSGGKRIVICEGEIDAMSVSQVQGNKWAVVSVPNGAQGAKKALGRYLEYLEKFDEIVLLFDMDAPGQEAVAECIPLFTPGKAKVATLPVKDANEMLKAGRDSELLSAIWNAKAPTYDGVFTGEEILELPDRSLQDGLPYPWSTLTKWTYGIRPHEMVALAAGTGVGKTHTLRSIAAHLVEQGQKVGLILLEEPDLQLTLNAVAGIVDKAIYHLPNVPVDEKRKAETRKRISKNLVMYRTEGSLDIEGCLNLIRYMVIAHGCQHIALDHITYLLDGESEEDQLAAMKRLMRGLNDLNKELPFCLFYVSHLRKSASGGKTAEEGGRVTLDSLVGGKACVQYANLVLALERDQQCPESKDSTTVRILKDRLSGQGTGETIHLVYDRTTGTKSEVADEFDNNSSGDSTPEF